LLEVEEIVKELFHIGDYYRLVKAHKPRSVEQLAMLLAIIRPSKAHLQNKPWEVISETVWDKPADGSYHFKKSHSVAYALSIVVQMNLLLEQANAYENF
jgi:DNA polymerase III alpha subunit